MSKLFLTPINLNQQELQNGRIHNLATAPGSPVNGQVYFDTVLLSMYFWNGTGWVSTDASKLSGTIPLSALTVNPLARSNHTGTQLAATISDLATTVQGYHLNQFATPNANIPMGGFKFTGLGTPTSAGDSAEYSWVINQVQSAAAGIASKVPADAVATSNIVLSGLQTIDGYTTQIGDRVLVVNQTIAAANGIYTVAAGAWARSTLDGPPPGELETGAMWMIQNGTTFSGTQWRLATTGLINVGTTALSIVQFGASSTYSNGNGLSLVGTVFSVNAVPNGGIISNSSGVSIDTSIVSRKLAFNIGDGSSTSFVLTHNLNTQDVVMQVRQAASPFAVVETDMIATSINTVTISFAAAPNLNQYRATVIG